MKKIIFIIICLWGVSVSCSEDHKIGAPDEIQPDYVLPQGDASDEANARIQDIFDTYGVLAKDDMTVLAACIWEK